MTQTRFDVLTIGNAIVDIIAPVEPGFIEREGMKEGIMHLIDTDRAEDLYGKMPLGRQQISGGSAANTARWLGRLGMRPSLVCAVGRDATGRALVADVAADGVDVRAVRVAGAPTGRIGVLVEPGGERSFVT